MIGLLHTLNTTPMFLLLLFMAKSVVAMECQKTPLDLYLVDHKELVDGHYDEYINQLISTAELDNNREVLKRLAYDLFSGPRNLESSYCGEYLRKLSILHLLFDSHDADIHDVSFVLRDLFQLWRNIWKDRLIRGTEFSALTHQQAPAILWSWNSSEFNLEDEILITHGGGYYHIFDFLHGRTTGYKLESETGIGIQVHPYEHDKSIFYAQFRPFIHADYPAILMARIKLKHLYAARRNNYEAGIVSPDHLIEPKIVRLPDQIFAMSLYLAVKEGVYSDKEPDLAKRIENAYIEFKNLENDKKKEVEELFCENFPNTDRWGSKIYLKNNNSERS